MKVIKVTMTIVVLGVVEKVIMLRHVMLQNMLKVIIYKNNILIG
tara:strand:+ start:67 stop:198 length:132 start_codon:yes stop_codon:yes gene_type:complete